MLLAPLLAGCGGSSDSATAAGSADVFSVVDEGVAPWPSFGRDIQSGQLIGQVLPIVSRGGVGRNDVHRELR